MEVGKHYFSNVGKLVNCTTYNKSSELCYNSVPMNLVESIQDRLKADGFVVVAVNQGIENNEKSIRAWLASFLCDPYVDKNPQQSAYARVQAHENAKFYINSHLAQPMHTDEGHTILCPRYAALYCVEPAIQGGDSILVKFASLYDLLKLEFGESVALLFEKNALVVDNAKGRNQKPVLYRVGSEIGISYSPVLKKMSCSKEVFMMFDFITAYVHNVQNQIRFRLNANEILILDNSRILHGRTCFARNSQRLLYRYWFGLISHG